MGSMDGGARWAAVHGVAQTRGEGERVLALESREGTRASRRTMLSSLRSPAQVEKNQGFLPPPEKDLERGFHTQLDEGPETP